MLVLKKLKDWAVSWIQSTVYSQKHFSPLYNHCQFILPNGWSTFQLYINLPSSFSLYDEYGDDCSLSLIYYIFIHLKAKNLFVYSNESITLSYTNSCLHWWSSHRLLASSLALVGCQERGRWQAHCHWALESNRSMTNDAQTNQLNAFSQSNPEINRKIVCEMRQ